MNHNTFTCEPCGFVTSSEAYYKSHMEGKKHRKCIACRNVTLFCPICQRNIASAAWTAHAQGRPHREEAARQNVSPDVSPQEGITSATEIYCDMCRFVVRRWQWERHVTSPRHKKREEYLSFKAALDEMEKDKNGLMTEGDFDFGIVEPNIAAYGTRRAAKVRLTAPSSRIGMISCRLLSSKDSQDEASSVYV
jgi:helicase MOV-10